MPASRSATNPPTSRTTTRRKRERGRYELSEVHAILDEALLCHVAISEGGTPLVLPTIHARIDDHLYLHGAASNHLLQAIAGGAEACVAATLVDELVLARSAFHHSLNYRSVVLFGRGSAVKDHDEKLAAVLAIVDHVLPGRSKDARPPSSPEMKSTLVVRIPITEASAKVRTGPPIDDEADLALPIWAGVVPVDTTLAAGSAAPGLAAGIPTPSYVTNPIRALRPR